MIMASVGAALNHRTMLSSTACPHHRSQTSWCSRHTQTCFAFKSVRSTASSKPQRRALLLRVDRLNRLQTQAAESAANTQKADTPKADPKKASAPSPPKDIGGSFIPVLKPEDLPKGVRKEVKVQGVGVLVFWYRNELYAIEARSPAEGAYSEGFVTAKFTQDYGIECPSTKSVFSLKTGEILTWYPNNPVLRVLTPQDTCRPLDIFPIKLTQEAIYVDVERAASSRAYQSTRGGADSSIERNNVYAIQPKSYIQGQDPKDPFSAPEQEIGGGTDTIVAKAATVTVAIIGVGGSAVAGTAYALYKENIPGLILFWLILFGASALFVVQYQNGVKREKNRGRL